VVVGDKISFVGTGGAHARAHGMESQLGLIEPGKYADMFLLDANHLIDIRNTRQISAVVADGRLYGKKKERASALRFVANQRDLSLFARIWFEG
jgi:cytosine/adenosine deaminase-related metal-dependent hydrolase